jgi:hypothetical protein
MRNVSENVVQKIKTRILCPITCFENRTFYEIMWKNIVGADRQQMTIRRMPIACWIPKATIQHSVYIKLTAFQ